MSATERFFPRDGPASIRSWCSTSFKTSTDYHWRACWSRRSIGRKRCAELICRSWKTLPMPLNSRFTRPAGLEASAIFAHWRTAESRRPLSAWRYTPALWIPGQSRESSRNDDPRSDERSEQTDRARIQLGRITHVRETETLHVFPGYALDVVRCDTLERVDEVLGFPVVACVQLRPREKIRLRGVRFVVEKVFRDELLLQLLQSRRIERSLLKVDDRRSHQLERRIGRDSRDE